MKLAISTLSCPAWDLDQIIDRCAAAGINGIDFRGIATEIDITQMPAFNAELPATLEKLRLRNLAMPCLNTSITLVTPATERWQMMLDEAARYASLAHKTATPFLRVFGGAVPKEMTRDEARSLAQRHARQLVKICRPHHCQILLEVHDAWSTSQGAMELVHEFVPDEFGILWDIEHSCRQGEAPLDTAKGLAKYIRHVHWKDHTLGEKHVGTLIGEGVLPLKKCVAALKAISYDAWITLETEKRWQPGCPEPEESIPQFAQWMNANW